jgi:hypothetical protein
MDAGRDSRGNQYIEFDITDDERIRVTRIAHATWADGPTLRVQKRRKSGNVVQGPELPLAAVPALIQALQSMAT